MTMIFSPEPYPDSRTPFPQVPVMPGEQREMPLTPSSLRQPLMMAMLRQRRLSMDSRQPPKEYRQVLHRQLQLFLRRAQMPSRQA